MKQTIAFLLLLVAACKGSKKEEKEPFLTPEQEAEIRKFVDDQMSALPDQIRLSDAQRANMRPFVTKAADAIFAAARKYHANPTANNLRRFSNKTRDIQIQLRKDLRPLLTSSQLNNFMVVFDRALQQIRSLRAQD